ncbi:glycosyltransferase family 1 protein [Frankia sp. AgB32]|uniref:glycosyltransferase family 4 protein n=1 Tax=Frankia sp. AgB32 TaxID=631119 RepID=UPI00200DFFF7|nr:glycosyltransferase family 1 protein [Frankia sp. AgB32]MCK9893829.1 glycosyltransferase family 4 protein [Frankia sp. AgB32]
MDVTRAAGPPAGGRRTTIVLDGTPLLGRRTGVGRYTEHLLAGLARLAAAAADAGGGGGGGGGGGPADGGGAAASWDLAATAFTWRGLDELAGSLPPGVRVAARRAPARLLHETWIRGEHPPVEWLTGPADVVHGTNFVLPPLRRARGVVTVHDLSYLRTPDTVSAASARYSDLVPRGLRRASAVLTPSRAVADEVISAYRLDPALVTPTPLGVDDAWFGTAVPTAAWRREHGLPERYLLFVGSVEPRKNLPVLLEAVRRLHAARLGAPPLVLVGPPGWGPTLDLAGLPAGSVITAGYLDADRLRATVAGASVLCFPSRYEGFGLPPLEALAAGVPVVAADIPTVREVVGELLAVPEGAGAGAGPGGADRGAVVTAARAGSPVRLVRQADRNSFADELAEAIINLLEDPGDADAGRRHARSFTWRRTAELTAAVYRRVAESA